MKNVSVEPIVVGIVGSVYGVKGWLRIYSFTEPKENILNYQPWQLYKDGSWIEIRIDEARMHGNEIVVKLAHCDDREAARSFTNAKIAVKRTQLPTLPLNEYYWTDLIGLQVVTIAGISLGVVEKLMETGSNDVLVVKGERQRLLPYLPHQVIKAIDLERGVIEVDWDPEF